MILELSTIKTTVTPILKKNHVNYAAVFGSYARGEANEDSDIDLLVKFDQPISLLKLIHVENELEDILQRKVDLITIGGLNPKIKPYIFKDLKLIYGQPVQE